MSLGFAVYNIYFIKCLKMYQLGQFFPSIPVRTQCTQTDHNTLGNDDGQIFHKRGGGVSDRILKRLLVEQCFNYNIVIHYRIWSEFKHGFQ